MNNIKNRDHMRNTQLLARRVDLAKKRAASPVTRDRTALGWYIGAAFVVIAELYQLPRDAIMESYPPAFEYLIAALAGAVVVYAGPRIVFWWRNR
jgi:hypothetical protein